MEFEPLNILLADDDPDDRFLFKTAIEETKVKVIFQSVNDGVQLMEYLSKPQNIMPHVIFLDLNMPRKSGIQCLQEIRNTARLRDISIAIYSTSSSENDIEETFVKGANIYIRKPSSFPKLKEVITQVISINWQYHTSGLNKDNFLLSL